MDDDRPPVELQGAGNRPGDESRRATSGSVLAVNPSAAGGSLADMPDYSRNPITLKFQDSTIERRFTVDHLSQALPTLRATLFGAVITYACFGILDAYVIPEAQTIAALIRFCLICPILLIVLLLSYTRKFPLFAKTTLSLSMLTSGLGIVAIIAVANEPGKNLYYAGLILVTIIGSSLVPIDWISVSIVSSILFLSYQIVAFIINPVSPGILLNNDFFLFGSVVAGIGAGYLQELKVRRIFIRDEGLRLAREQSEELRVKAEAANKAKSEFLAVMSHELRTPLNAILGFSEIMKMRVFGPIGSDRYLAYAGDIHQSAQHLLGIITDILDFSKAEIGRLSLSETEFEIIGIIDQCLRLLRERAGEQGLRLWFDSANGRGLSLRGDERLTRQALLNVLGNALKFTPSGGSVGVSVADDPCGGVIVRISDTGIGIAEQDLARVLEPFVQVASALSRSHGGAGLGLPLVNTIMELHGGHLAIESALGSGTAVALHFPAERVRRPSAQRMAGVA